MESFKIFFEQLEQGELLPINKRRKLLIESQYVFPSSGNKAIMDLYALYSLWWELGDGKATYGYAETSIRNHKVREKINRYFEEALATISNILLEEAKEAKEAISDEAENVFDEYLIPSTDIVKWFKENNLLLKLQRAYNNGEGGVWLKVFNYDDTSSVFRALFWEQHANLYGGEKWVDITEALKQLDNSIRRGDTQKLMESLDRFMHLEHNTGSLTSKLKRLKVSNETLNLRAEFNSPKEFLPYVSDQVAKLINLMR